MRYGIVAWTITAPENRSRLVAALAAAGVQTLLFWLLLSGLTVHFPQVVERSMAVFGVAPPPPPPPPERVPPPPPRHSTAAKGSPSPPNLRSKATPVAAPTPIIPLPAPPIMVTAPKPDAGAQATTGASDIAGPGTGAGGVGNGHGGGGNGDGIGPEWRSGRLKDSDYPADASRAGVSGTVAVRYLVDTDGRAKQCAVTRSSGSAALDDTTCRLIEQRFRFSPARDGNGRPVRAWIIEQHEWVIEHQLAPPDDRDGR